MINNRQINTNVNKSIGSMIELEVVQVTKLNGRDLKVGDLVKVSKSEAKRLLISSKDFFRIHMD